MPELILVAEVVSVVAEAARPWLAIPVTAPDNFDVTIAAPAATLTLVIASAAISAAYRPLTPPPTTRRSQW